MKLTIGNYTIEGTTYNWNLVKTEPYTNEKGESKTRTKTWYYPKFEQALQTMMDERLKDMEVDVNIKDNVGIVLSSLKHLKEEIIRAIKK